MSESIGTIISNINNTEHQGALINLFKAVFGLAVDSRDGNLNFGDRGSGIDSIKFNIDPNITVHKEGQMHWDAANNTLSIGMIGGVVELQVGQEHLIYCFNQTGSPIPNGAAVYVSDAGDSKVRIALADADNTDSTPEAIVIGLATELIANGSSGFITTQGLVRDVDTQGLTEGVPIWLSDTTPGAWTIIPPAAPSLKIPLGYVVYAHNNNGIILVNVGFVPRLQTLSDVYGTPNDGDTVRWNATNKRFEYGA
jgi:hypothetical protein